MTNDYDPTDYSPELHDDYTDEEMLGRMNDLIKRIPKLMNRLGLVADGRQLLGPAPARAFPCQCEIYQDCEECREPAPDKGE